MRFFDMTHKAPSDAIAPSQNGRRARTVQRLQIGVGGILLMLMLVTLANIVQDKARAIDATSVPEAASTTEPGAAATVADPLVEAGVVPDLDLSGEAAMASPDPAPASPAN